MPKILALLALLFALPDPAMAQDGYSSVITPATEADIASAISAATPPPCGIAQADTLNGSAGSGAMCMPRLDATRPTPVQTVNAALAADCTWSVTFSRSFTSSSPVIFASVIQPTNATQPLPCAATTRSATAASGKCFPGQTTALNLGIVTGGLTLNPTGTTCTAGLPVVVVGREATQ